MKRVWQIKIRPLLYTSSFVTPALIRFIIHPVVVMVVGEAFIISVHLQKLAAIPCTAWSAPKLHHHWVLISPRSARPRGSGSLCPICWVAAFAGDAQYAKPQRWNIGVQYAWPRILGRRRAKLSRCFERSLCDELGEIERPWPWGPRRSCRCVKCRSAIPSCQRAISLVACNKAHCGLFAFACLLARCSSPQSSNSSAPWT